MGKNELTDEEIVSGIKTRVTRVFYWVCPVCGKEIEALNFNQVWSLARSHLTSHKLKSVRKTLSIEGKG